MKNIKKQTYMGILVVWWSLVTISVIWSMLWRYWKNMFASVQALQQDKELHTRCWIFIQNQLINDPSGNSDYIQDARGDWNFISSCKTLLANQFELVEPEVLKSEMENRLYQCIAQVNNFRDKLLAANANYSINTSNELEIDFKDDTSQFLVDNLESSKKYFSENQRCDFWTLMN